MKVVVSWLVTLMVLAICVQGCTSDSIREDDSNRSRPVVQDKLVPPPYGQVQLEGKLGIHMNLILEKRIYADFAQEEIITEATEAFRTRMDDQFHENRGTWQGEFWGKWILSAVAAYNYAPQPQLIETIRRETMALIATQREDGYIGTYQESGFVTGNTWNVWCRKYTLWGLLEAYLLLEEPAILQAAERHMQHLMSEVGPGKIEMVHTGNFVGLPSSSLLSPLVSLYEITGRKQYLDYAEYIVANWGLEEGSPPDIVDKGLGNTPVHLWFPEAGKWTKAYEFISCIEGLVDLYKIGGDPRHLQAATNTYKQIRDNERVITGGIGHHDKLSGAAFLPDGLNEPCDVVYWERLSAQLLALTGDQSYADEIERLAYNTLLGTFNTEGDWAVRRLGLNEPHLVAPLHCFTNHHQCCVANIPRGLLQLADVAVMTHAQEDALFINLFIPGSYTLTSAGGDMASIKIETTYPEEGNISVYFANLQSIKSKLYIRQPGWCAGGQITTNNQATIQEENGRWLLEGTWIKGDQVSITLPLSPRAVMLPDRSDYLAIMRGPVVLARSSRLENADLDAYLSFPSKIELTSARPSKLQPKTWMQFTCSLEDGNVIQLCDYASTGKEFDKPQDPYALKEMLTNQVNTDHRVWFKLLP